MRPSPSSFRSVTPRGCATAYASLSRAAGGGAGSASASAACCSANSARSRVRDRPRSCLALPRAAGAASDGQSSACLGDSVSGST